MHSLILAAAPLLSTISVLDDPQEGKNAGRADARTTHDAARFLTSRKSGIDLPLPNEEDAFFFCVFGDRTGGLPSGVAILRQAVAETNLLGPDLVMTVGDLIQGYNTETPWMAEMREYKDAMSALRMPWFPVAGNHDIYYRPEQRGAPRPAEEHEGRYEMHFGPLWYAFEHKNSWFIVLYTDEPNPDTGERNFNKPECQRMSPEQFEWLGRTLEVTKDAAHVFVFCHHPRWIGDQYGDDWTRVHERLVEAGNVSAVFGGHIHRMRYDPKDGIEYFALATIGAHQDGAVPEAGYLHCYDLVTVRGDRIERATLPVGAAMDPREITSEVSNEAPALTEVQPHWLGEIALGELTPESGGGVDQTLEFTLTNPTSGEVEMEATFASPDPRWSFRPSHLHGTLAPSGTLRFAIHVSRPDGSIDGGLHLPTMDLGFDYLTESARFSIPQRTLWVPFDLSTLPPPEVPGGESVLELAGDGGHVRVPAGRIEFEDGPFTLEAWVRPDGFKGRQGVVCKTENSEYGFFANDGELTYMVHLDGEYVEVGEGVARLRGGAWQHIAGVFDGEEIRLYTDGKLVARTPASGRRTRNEFPLVVGGDVNSNGRATATLDGALDEIRLSRGAIYHGDEFAPARRFESGDATVLLLHMDAVFGPFLRGAECRGAEALAGARLVVE